MRGFSLLEVLLATSLLATGVLSLAHLLAVGVGVNVASKDVTEATVLPAQKIEELRGGGDLTGGEEAIGGFRRRWSVEPLAGSSSGPIVVHVVVEPSASTASAGRSARLTAVIGSEP